MLEDEATVSNATLSREFGCSPTFKVLSLSLSRAGLEPSPVENAMKKQSKIFLFILTLAYTDDAKLIFNFYPLSVISKPVTSNVLQLMIAS